MSIQERKDYNKAVHLWLMSGVFLVIAMVVIGGITRLTQSGLSMVEWKPITGIIPPLNEQDWLIEFEKYKQSPEFKHYNYDFTVSNFKSIYFWEYLHRLLARMIGIVFVIPCGYFWWKGFFNRDVKIKVSFIFLLGTFQGFLGWFMVKSGLVDSPHVSHLRLAMHFLSALFLIIAIYHTALSVRYGNSNLVENRENKTVLWIFSTLLLVQIIYGALVAGLKAGKVFNTFPFMGDSFIPDGIGYAFKNLGIVAIWENPFVVQFIHRWVAILLVFVGVVVFMRLKNESKNLRLKTSLHLFLVTLILQVTLGVITLVLSVPIWLGVLHQLVAIFLVIFLVRILFFHKRGVKILVHQ